MSNLVIPQGYKAPLPNYELQRAIAFIKESFQTNLSNALNLRRVSAPLFVASDSGLNDNLNGVERPVRFDIPGVGGKDAEVVHSLAKWKRLALKRYGFHVGKGLYTDMNAIRRDEDLDNLHSIYVDQWDWEKVISKDARNITTLKDTVKQLYSVFKATENYINSLYPNLKKYLPDEISFITTQELEDMYPNLSEKEREDAICRERKAVFLMGIGDTLKSGKKHDGRSPDYDDWSLNGDILFYYPLFDKALELSSMGIRVDKKALESQLIKANCQERKNLPFHQLLLNEELPQTIGGGIGQSRICMFFLQKAHIGEVQASIWDENTLKKCKENNIEIL